MVGIVIGIIFGKAPQKQAPLGYDTIPQLAARQGVRMV
jgi:hypothetical protein